MNCLECNKKITPRSKRCMQCVHVYYRRVGHPLRKENPVSRTPIYKAWIRMIHSTNAYDPAWKCYDTFAAQIPPRPYVPYETRLVKIKKNKPYEINNVKWIVILSEKEYEALAKNMPT